MCDRGSGDAAPDHGRPPRLRHRRPARLAPVQRIRRARPRRRPTAGRARSVRGPPRSRRRPIPRRRHEFVVGSGARVPPPGAGCGDHGSARPHESRDVRRPDARARGAVGRAAGHHHPGRSGPRLLLRLRFRLRRGGRQDVSAVLARPRPAEQTTSPDVARWVSRRHVHPDERVRSRGWNARGMVGRADRADLRRRPTTPPRRITPAAPRRITPAAPRRRLRRPADTGRTRPPRRDRRGDRRTRGAGRGRHEIPPPLVPRHAPTRVRRRGRAADLRRDRHRIRPDGNAVRGRRGGRDSRRPVRRQGTHRRLPVPGRDAVYGRDGDDDQRGAGRWPDARADVHGEPARVRSGDRVHRTAAEP